MALIDQLKPKIFAMFAKALRPTIAGVRFASTDLSTEAKMEGETITVPVDRDPDPDRVIKFVEGITPVAANEPKPGYFDIKLDQYYERPFQIGAKEIAQVVKGVVPSEIRTAALDMGMHINRAVLRLYRQIPDHIVSATPFDGNDLVDLKDINVKAAGQWIPPVGRTMLLSPNTFGEALSNSRLHDADKSGLPPGMGLEGFMTRGYNWVQDQQVVKHIVGTKTGSTFKANGAHAKGVRTINIDAIAGTLADGDILRVHAGGAVVGAVKGDHAAQSTAIPLYHDSLVAVADDVRLNVLAGGVCNLVFAPSALKIAVRVVVNPLEAGSNTIVETDPITGLPIVMHVWHGHNVTRWGFSILYGVGVPQPQRAIRLISDD